MAGKKQENQNESKPSENDEGFSENAAKVVLSELVAPCWSVATFEKCAASNLTYEQAERKLAELAAEKAAGLCIITDEAGERIAGKR